MNVLTPAESELLTLVRAILGVADGMDAAPTLLDRKSFPTAHSPTFTRLLHHSLSAGSTLALCRLGGARKGRHLAGADATVDGRVWERHPTFRWGFDQGTAALLAWLYAEPLGAPKIAATRPLPPSVTPGDRFFRLLAVDLLVRERLDKVLEDVAGLAEPLCWFPALVPLSGKFTAPDAQAWEPLFTPFGVVLLEALQPAFTRWTLLLEGHKQSLTDPARVSALGVAQEAFLQGYLGACDRAGRRDLGAFVLDASAALSRSTPDQIAGNLDRGRPLRERSEAVRGRLALFRAHQTWVGWNDEHRGVRFVDDGYVTAQHLLSVWEKRGKASWALAEAHLRANA